jgi:hypothetical protein
MLKQAPPPSAAWRCSSRAACDSKWLGSGGAATATLQTARRQSAADSPVARPTPASPRERPAPRGGGTLVRDVRSRKFHLSATCEREILASGQQCQTLAVASLGLTHHHAQQRHHHDKRRMRSGQCCAAQETLGRFGEEAYHRACRVQIRPALSSQASFFGGEEKTIASRGLRRESLATTRSRRLAAGNRRPLPVAHIIPRLPRTPHRDTFFGIGSRCLECDACCVAARGSAALNHASPRRLFRLPAAWGSKESNT